MGATYTKAKLASATTIRKPGPACKTDRCQHISQHLQSFIGVHVLQDSRPDTAEIVRHAVDDAVCHSTRDYPPTGRLFFDRSRFPSIEAAMADRLGKHEPEHVLPMGTLIIIENVEASDPDDMKKLFRLAHRGTETGVFNTLVTTRNTATAESICAMNQGKKFSRV